VGVDGDVQDSLYTVESEMEGWGDREIEHCTASVLTTPSVWGGRDLGVCCDEQCR
jgi:hypothetical protein